MGVNANVDLTAEQRRIILELLRTHLPNVTVWAYGSRVRWNARPYSDLDLVAFTSPGQESQLANLKDAFEESNLPFGVDLLTWDDLPESFHRRIKKEYAVLQKQATKAGRMGRHNLPLTSKDAIVKPIDVTPGDLETVRRILQKHVPELDVHAFGSRVSVSWTARETSDLDLALMTTEPLDLLRVAEMREAFNESDLPFRVDLVDWATTSENFRNVIEREYVTIAKGKERSESGAWPTVTLGDCMTINDSTYSPKEAWPFINYLDTGHITGNSISEIQHLVAGYNTIPSRARRKVQPGDIVYSTVRPDQRHFGLLKEVPENFLASTGFAVIRGKDGLAFTDFIYWFLTQDHIVDHLHTIAEHSVSAYPSIRPSDIERLVLRLPPLPEQRVIAHVLGTLDDKIELNRRTSETLEAMARALFKSWFIDFDPVHAKATLKQHAAPEITPPLRGSRQAKGASPQARRWGVIRRGYSQRTLTTAHTLRRNRTDAEGILWHYLRHNQLDGHRFRRRHPIGPYIVDFACLARKVLIELNGSQHAERQDDDKKRDAFLHARGYRVLRFWNNDVVKNGFGVLERIYDAVTAHPPPAPPAPGGLAAPTPPQGGSDWTVERARAYLDGMDPEIAALFPDRFDDSELGKIPEGWEVSPLSEVVAVNPPRCLQKGDIAPYLDMANMPTKGHTPDTMIDRPYGSGMRFVNGDTLVARITPCLENGKIAYVDFLRDGMTGWGSTEYIVMRPKPPLPDEFAYCLARSTSFREFAIQNMTGSSGRQRVAANVLSQFLLPVPSEPVAKSFERLIRPLIVGASESIRESNTLATLRDALLPKLISGKMRTSNVPMENNDAN